MIVGPKLAASWHCTRTSDGRSGQLFDRAAIDPELVR